MYYIFQYIKIFFSKVLGWLLGVLGSTATPASATHKYVGEIVRYLQELIEVNEVNTFIKI